jgi:hypothetical protein
VKDYWSAVQQILPDFLGKTVTRDRFFHILIFLSFSGSTDECDKTDKNYDLLWKMRNIQ